MGDEWISLVRIARDLGDTTLLLPNGITSLIEIPYPLHQAIDQALTYISWQENLASDEMPPREIWLDPEALREWFEDVRRQRERGSSDSDREIDDPVQNELAAELRRELSGRR